jgi:nucleotide-binding universal stress UspA family protein
MKVVVWLSEGTWEAGVDAVRGLLPADAQVTLLHVVDPRWADAADAARSGLLGRGRPARGASGIPALADEAERRLLEAAIDRLGRPAGRDARRGWVEREVVAAAADADLLLVVRDGDHTRLGPKSLGPPTRFVVDHAPCPVLLVWPDEAPSLATIPPPPASPPAPPPPPAS